jgi:putative FmdB family regulatory protein
MPIYEYRCADCATEFEELTFSAAADDTTTCRRCGSQHARRILSAFAVHGRTDAPAPEPGPCGGCGAAQRGMCGAD